MARNKIVFGSEVMIDLTADTVDAAHLLPGYTAHDRSGEIITGSCPYDMDTSGADATQAEILDGKKAGINGVMVTGTMPNNGQQMFTHNVFPGIFDETAQNAYIESTETFTRMFQESCLPFLSKSLACNVQRSLVFDFARDRDFSTALDLPLNAGAAETFHLVSLET